jgi:hypothetical protein
MRQRPVELQPLEIGLESFARDASRFGLGPQRLKPLGKILLDRALIGGDFVAGGPRLVRQQRDERRRQSAFTGIATLNRSPSKDSRGSARFWLWLCGAAKAKLQASRRGAIFDQLLFPGKRMADDRVEAVELSLPAEDLADAFGLRHERRRIARPARSHAYGKIALRTNDRAITSSTEKPVP